MALIHAAQSFSRAFELGPDTAAEAPCYAVKVRAASEEAIAEALRRKNHKALTPLHTVTRQYSDRLKKVSLALFPGYVFVWMQEKDWLSVVSTNGVSYVVRTGQSMVPLTFEETRSIEILCRSKSFCEPCPMFTVGQTVVVERGPFAGLVGVLDRVKDETSVIVSIQSLHRAVRVTIGTANIRIIDQQSAA